MTGTSPWPTPAAWLSVAVAGFAGTELRYALGLLFPESSTAFPLTTFSINVIGSFALAALTGLWLLRPAAGWLRAALGPGLLGSFTTFSAVAYAVDQLAWQGLHWLWAFYLLTSLAAGLAAAWVGFQTGSGLGQRQEAQR